jgi:acyl-CoA reductase-like NAD-dependent aldehyde dehydrogenase
MLKEKVQYQLNIKGISSSEYIEIKNPYSGEVVGFVALADENAIKAAIKIAHETFKSSMSKMPAHKRSQILTKVSQALLEQQEEFASIIAQEGGKPIKDARIEVTRAASTFAIAANETLHLDGEQIAMDRHAGNETRLAMVLREPLGVIAAITPFNFPLNLVAHKLAPAFATGNTVVLKPASQTPLSSFKLKEVLIEAGLPEGALNIVPCPGSKSSALVSDPRLAMLTFTGSPSVGWRLRKEIASGTRIILELGGNAGLIVHNDADLEKAAQAACRGGYVNAGQTCISVQRVYVQESVYDNFLQKFTQLVKQLKTGDPLNDSVEVGPMIDKTSLEKTMLWINEATKTGAKLIVGGKQLEHNILEPAILVDTKDDMLVVCQEVFAPLVSVMKYKTIDEAIEAMNNSRYGLQAGVFTQNLEIAFKAARNIDAGGVMVNDASTFRADHMPYGGRKESGIGLEGVKYAMHEMTQPKFICVNLPSS